MPTKQSTHYSIKISNKVIIKLCQKYFSLSRLRSEAAVTNRISGFVCDAFAFSVSDRNALKAAILIGACEARGGNDELYCYAIFFPFFSLPNYLRLERLERNQLKLACGSW
jgi:hypothetical protein